MIRRLATALTGVLVFSLLTALGPAARAETTSVGPLTVTATDRVLQTQCFAYQNLTYDVGVAADVGWSLQVGHGPRSGLPGTYLCDDVDGPGTYTVHAVLSSHDSGGALPDVVATTSFVLRAPAAGATPSTGPASEGPLGVVADDQPLQRGCVDYPAVAFSVDVPADVRWSLQTAVFKPGASGWSDDASGTGPGHGVATAYLCDVLDGVGSYTVRAQLTSRDAAGDELPHVLAWTTFTITPPDTIAPTAVLTSPKAALTLAPTLVVGWSGADAGSGVASYDVRYRTARWDRALGAWSYPTAWHRTRSRSAAVPAAAGYVSCFAVRSRDRSGNLSPWSPQRCSARALDDLALAAGAGSARRTGGGFYAGTYTTTTLAGAVLTRTHVLTARLGLVATRCPSCGTVGVYLDGRLLSTVRLRAATTERGALIALPATALRSTTVTVRGLSPRLRWWPCRSRSGSARRCPRPGRTPR